MRRAAIQVAGAIGSAKERDLVKALLAVLETAIRRCVPSPSRSWANSVQTRPCRGWSGWCSRAEPNWMLPPARPVAWVPAALKRWASSWLMRLPPLRRRIAAALALGGTQGAVLAAVQALADPDPSVVEAAARSLAAEIPSLSDAQRRALVDQLMEVLHPKAKTPPTAASEAAMIRILAGLHDPRAEEVYWARIDATHPVPLRRRRAGTGHTADANHGCPVAEAPRLCRGCRFSGGCPRA